MQGGKRTLHPLTNSTMGVLKMKIHISGCDKQGLECLLKKKHMLWIPIAYATSAHPNL